MDYEELVRHALAVPSIIQEDNRKLATAHRLRMRASLPNAEGALDLASRILDASIAAMEDGELDPLFGGWAELNPIVDRIFDRLPDELPERETRHTLEMLLTAVKYYADTEIGH